MKLTPLILLLLTYSPPVDTSVSYQPNEPRRSSLTLALSKVAVLPFALLLQRFPIAKALSLIIFLWGVTVILTVVVKDYKGLIVQRVFLGLLESCVSPGFVLVTGMWYKKVSCDIPPERVQASDRRSEARGYEASEVVEGGGG